jgi:hypothetical protein
MNRLLVKMVRTRSRHANCWGGKGWLRCLYCRVCSRVCTIWARLAFLMAPGASVDQKLSRENIIFLPFNRVLCTVANRYYEV